MIAGGQQEPDPRIGFRPLGERPRYEGSFFKLVTGTFVGPDGFTFERDIVKHPGAVAVVALEEDRRHVLLVRQYRAAVGAGILELPAGKRDLEGEPASDCARRELMEEIGQDAAVFTELGWFYNSPGFTDERTVCFLAEGLTPVDSDAQGVEEMHMTVERIALDDIDELVAAGDLVDAKTLIGLMLARTKLAETAPPPAPAPSPAPLAPPDADASTVDAPPAGGLAAGPPPASPAEPGPSGER